MIYVALVLLLFHGRLDGMESWPEGPAEKSNPQVSFSESAPADCGKVHRGRSFSLPPFKKRIDQLPKTSPKSRKTSTKKNSPSTKDNNSSGPLLEASQSDQASSRGTSSPAEVMAPNVKSTRSSWKRNLKSALTPKRKKSSDASRSNSTGLSPRASFPPPDSEAHNITLETGLEEGKMERRYFSSSSSSSGLILTIPLTEDPMATEDSLANNDHLSDLVHTPKIPLKASPPASHRNMERKRSRSLSPPRNPFVDSYERLNSYTAMSTGCSAINNVKISIAATTTSSCAVASSSKSDKPLKPPKKSSPRTPNSSRGPSPRTPNSRHLTPRTPHSSSVSPRDLASDVSPLHLPQPAGQFNGPPPVPPKLRSRTPSPCSTPHLKDNNVDVKEKGVVRSPSPSQSPPRSPLKPFASEGGLMSSRELLRKRENEELLSSLDQGIGDKVSLTAPRFMPILSGDYSDLCVLQHPHGPQSARGDGQKKPRRSMQKRSHSVADAVHKPLASPRILPFQVTRVGSRSPRNSDLVSERRVSSDQKISPRTPKANRKDKK